MSAEPDRAERLRLVGENMDFELPLDLSRYLAEKAAQLDISVDLLVNEALREALERDGHEVGPPLFDWPLAQMPSTAPDRDRQQERRSEA
jgi:hypothetical protein